MNQNSSFAYSASDFNNLRAHQEQLEVTNFSEGSSLPPFSSTPVKRMRVDTRQAHEGGTPVKRMRVDARQAHEGGHRGKYPFYA